MPLDIDPVHFPTSKDIRCRWTDLPKYSSSPTSTISSTSVRDTITSRQFHIHSSSTITWATIIPGGSFANVRRVLVFDERPFEHGFLSPLGTNTSVDDDTECEEWSNTMSKERLPMIRYLSLRKLRLPDIHDDDDVEQFFFARRLISSEMHLSIDPRQLKRVRQDFMRDERRMNYSKVKSFYFWNEINWSKWIIWHLSFNHWEDLFFSLMNQSIERAMNFSLDDFFHRWRSFIENQSISNDHFPWSIGPLSCTECAHRQKTTSYH